MKSKWIALAGSVALMAANVRAVSITGSADMSGTVTLDSFSLNTATAAVRFSSVTVGGAQNGSFFGTAGNTVTWNPFSWRSPDIPVTPLWIFTDAVTGFTYSFDLYEVHVVTQNNNFLNLLGSGRAEIWGPASPYDTTLFVDWTFTISSPGGGPHANFDFTFANSQVSAKFDLPDSGATATLLGASLVGIGSIRRLLFSNLGNFYKICP